MVEQLIRNQQVVGSSPISSSISEGIAVKLCPFFKHKDIIYEYL